MELKDAIFEIVSLCKKDPYEGKINGTIGSLKHEDGRIVTYDAYYDSFRELGNDEYAAYAQKPKGNDEFLKDVYDYVFEGRVKTYTEVIATSGGTGAVAAAFNVFSKKTKTLLIPNVCWPNTALIAKSMDLKTVTFDVEDENDLINKVKETEGDLIVYINDPAENPTGISMGKDRWSKIMKAFNESGKKIYLVDDIAYIDYCYDDDNKDYMDVFNDASENVITAVAFSSSKSFSAYGIRLGALLLTSKDNELVDEMSLSAQLYVRTTVSNVNAGAMIAFSKLIKERKEDYLKERISNKEILRRRAELFLSEAKENDLPVFPYHDGFFVTVKFTDNDERDRVHQKMLDNHLYFVKTNLGIRVAVCSIPLSELKGLGKKIKECME